MKIINRRLLISASVIAIVLGYFLLLKPTEDLSDQVKETEPTTTQLETGTSREKITWLQQDALPYFIPSGEYKGQGLFEVVQRMIQERLPEYEHENITLPQDRLFGEFKTDKKVCSVAVVITPERQQYMYFSAPTVFLVPHRITILKENWGLYDNQNQVSLEELLGNASLILGITEGRSYGNVIDSILEEYEGQPNVHQRYGTLYTDLYDMLLLGRVHYIIGYPTESIYTARVTGSEDEIMTLSIEENEGYIFGVAGLPKNEWGEEMVVRINAILLEIRASPEYQEIMRDWQGIQADDTEFRADYDNLFLKTVE